MLLFLRYSDICHNIRLINTGLKEVKGCSMKISSSIKDNKRCQSVHVWKSRDEELRWLRQMHASKHNAWVAQKKRADQLKKQLDKERKKLKEITRRLK